MSACNERPGAEHPLHGSGVACHLPAEHVALSQPHSWDIEAAMARAEIIGAAVQGIREKFGAIDRFDILLPQPIVVYDVDPDTGERSPDPYRVWSQAAGPWVVAFVGEREFAIWKETGDVYEVGPDGAVGEDPVIRGPDR